MNTLAPGDAGVSTQYAHFSVHSRGMYKLEIVLPIFLARSHCVCASQSACLFHHDALLGDPNSRRSVDNDIAQCMHHHGSKYGEHCDFAALRDDNVLLRSFHAIHTSCNVWMKIGRYGV